MSPLKKDLTAMPTPSKNCFKPLALAVAMAISVPLATPVLANTFVVINENDIGPGSLRRAVFDANNTAGDDTVVFASNLEHKTIKLSSGEIVVGGASNTDSLTITGPIENTPNGIIIDAMGTSRIFNASAATDDPTFTLENLTLTGGNATTSGGAITVDKIGLTLNNSVITGNTSLVIGGGIYTYKSETVLNQSVLSGNTATNGAGINSRLHDLTFNESTVIGNQGGTNWAAILFSPSASPSKKTLTLNQSTVSNHTGTGIKMNTTGGSLIINQSTISGNSSNGVSTSAKSIIVNQTTITNNLLTGLHSTNWGSIPVIITLTNSILSNNQGITYGNFHGSTGLTQLNINHSLFGDDISEITGTSSGTYLSDAPDLGTLQSNGGKTQTQRPNVNSPAANSGSDTDATESFDQRGSGFARIQGTVDMGAIERQTIINGGNNEVIKRGEMARALLEKIAVTPPIFVTGIEYHDVQAMDPNANWIVQFMDGFSDDGCEDDRFCADSIVSREEMARLFLKVSEDTSYQAPTAQGTIFSDVNGLAAFNINWINDLYTKGFTTGCGEDNNANLLFCPKSPVTREWFDSLLTQLP